MQLFDHPLHQATMYLEHEKPFKVATPVEPPMKNKTDQKPFKRKILWINVAVVIVMHLSAIYGLFLAATSAKLLTILWVLFLMFSAGQGVTLGAHRLYSHRALKASWTARVVLIFLQTIAGQNSIYMWAKEHRQHHKYSDTDADPHNATNGFFYSHVGWLMLEKHPDVIEKAKTINVSDLERDEIVMFQERHYKKLYITFGFLLPILFPYFFLGETLWNSFFVGYIARLMLFFNITWLINSAAHIYGNRPFTKNIVPVETGVVAFLTMGEGWHNYHHTFPWDYRSAEFGQDYNLTTTVIDFLAKYKIFYDLRSATPEMVSHRVLKQGDGTHPKVTEFLEIKNAKALQKRNSRKSQTEINLKADISETNKSC